jgi:hypothetical protein
LMTKPTGAGAGAFPSNVMVPGWLARHPVPDPDGQGQSPIQGGGLACQTHWDHERNCTMVS